MTSESWVAPKTNWKSGDRFNYQDYNRIKNNIQFLKEKANDLCRPFDIKNMGADIEERKARWPVIFFNAWEENLDILNDNILKKDYGEKQTFYENGVFIQWEELNRIESALSSMKDILERQAQEFRKISFRLGAYREIRI